MFISRPYTPNIGLLSTVWYDRKQISPAAPDDESVDVMANMLSALIQNEVDQGIPLNRIVVGKVMLLFWYFGKKSPALTFQYFITH